MPAHIPQSSQAPPFSQSSQNHRPHALVSLDDVLLECSSLKIHGTGEETDEPGGNDEMFDERSYLSVMAPDRILNQQPSMSLAYLSSFSPQFSSSSSPTFVMPSTLPVVGVHRMQGNVHVRLPVVIDLQWYKDGFMNLLPSALQMHNESVRLEHLLSSANVPIHIAIDDVMCPHIFKNNVNKDIMENFLTSTRFQDVYKMDGWRSDQYKERLCFIVTQMIQQLLPIRASVFSHQTGAVVGEGIISTIVYCNGSMDFQFQVGSTVLDLPHFLSYWTTTADTTCEVCFQSVNGEYNALSGFLQPLVQENISAINLHLLTCNLLHLVNAVRPAWAQVVYNWFFSDVKDHELSAAPLGPSHIPLCLARESMVYTSYIHKGFVASVHDNLLQQSNREHDITNKDMYPQPFKKFKISP